MVQGKDSALPVWVRMWFVFSGLIQLWDASFIILRPHSMPGGKYFQFFSPYEIYIAVDKRYGDMNDTFVIAQSWMNYVEVLLGFLTLYLSKQRSRSAAPLAFLTATMTFWKTTVYLLQYIECLVGGGEHHGHNTTADIVLYLYFPNAIWTGVPLLIMCSMWSRLVNGPQTNKKDD